MNMKLLEKLEKSIFEILDNMIALKHNKINNNSSINSLLGGQINLNNNTKENKIIEELLNENTMKKFSSENNKSKYINY